MLADADKLQERSTRTLKGLLPSEARHYGFDRGLVLMSADARHLVLRGAEYRGAEYTPPPPPVAEQGRLLANGQPRDRADASADRRSAVCGTPRSTAHGSACIRRRSADDLLEDPWGQNLRYPYTVLDEGALARRSFWRGRKDVRKHFDDRYEYMAELTPVEGAPVLLKARFFKDPKTDEALRLADPGGLLVWPARAWTVPDDSRWRASTIR